MNSTMRLLTAFAATIVLSLGAATASANIVFDIDLSNINSWDGQGDSDNDVLVIDVGALLSASGTAGVVTGIGWDVSITPVGLSWYSEATALFTDSGGGQGVNVSPGAGDEFAGDGIPLSYSSGGILDLTDNGIPDIILNDGLLMIEFYEGFDDVADAIDAGWDGTLSVAATKVPIPPAFLLLFSGLVSAGFIGRKKA